MDVPVMTPMFFLLKADPYTIDVAFAIEETNESVYRYLKRNLRMPQRVVDSLKEYDKEKPKFQGRTNLFDNGAILVRLNVPVKGPITMGLLVHEVFHAVSYILNNAGMPLRDDSEEAWAYLLQDLTKKALDRVAKVYWK